METEKKKGSKSATVVNGRDRGTAEVSLRRLVQGEETPATSSGAAAAVGGGSWGDCDSDGTLMGF